MPKPIEIDATRPSFRITEGGVERTWEYDVLTLKLEAERLEQEHGLARKGEKTLPPTKEMISEFAKFLEEQGIGKCSIDLAFRVHSLITVQFNQIARSVAEQVAEFLQ